MLKKNKKKLMKNADKTYIQMLVGFLFVLYLISTTFDLAVTLTVLHYKPDFFFTYEGNNMLRNCIAAGKPVMFSPSIWLDLAMPLIFLLSYALYEKKKNEV